MTGLAADFTHDRPGTPAAAWRDRLARETLPAVDLVGPGAPGRVVVLAAHPDDESLGAGGLVARAHREGLPTTLVLATAGERSHPRSSTTTPETLGPRRLVEAAQAWRRLGGDPGDLVVLDLPDGGVTAHEDALVDRLVEVVGDGRDTLLVAPWRHDGHPDHEAAGRAAARAAYRTGARVLEYPVWFWHRSSPAEAPWADLRALALDPQDVAAKAAAVRAHASQVGPLSEEPGDETLLGPALLEHFAGSVELFVSEESDDDSLDVLHSRARDPWGVDSRWYEERKRGLSLAVLPRRSFARGLEVGCSTGALAAALAGRCDRLLAIDRSEHALAAARARLRGLAHVDVERVDAPREWPPGEFDLVVVSEMGYFLSPADLDRLVARVAGCLTHDGVLLLCHWRHPMVGWPISGPDVHARFRDAAGIPPVAATYADRDVEIVVHCDARLLPEPAA